MYISFFQGKHPLKLLLFGETNDCNEIEKGYQIPEVPAIERQSTINMGQQHNNIQV